jgi:hypothetical protein
MTDPESEPPYFSRDALYVAGGVTTLKAKFRNQN